MTRQVLESAHTVAEPVTQGEPEVAAVAAEALGQTRMAGLPLKGRAAQQDTGLLLALVQSVVPREAEVLAAQVQQRAEPMSPVQEVAPSAHIRRGRRQQELAFQALTVVAAEQKAPTAQRLVVAVAHLREA